MPEARCPPARVARARGRDRPRAARPTRPADHGRGCPGSQSPRRPPPLREAAGSESARPSRVSAPAAPRERPGAGSRANRGVGSSSKGRPGGSAPRAPGRWRPGPRFPSLPLPPPPPLRPSPPLPSLPALPLLLPGHVSPFFVCSGNNFSPLGAPRPDAPRRRRAGGGTGRGERRGRREDARRSRRTPQVPCRAATPAPLPPAAPGSPRRVRASLAGPPSYARWAPAKVCRLPLKGSGAPASPRPAPAR